MTTSTDLDARELLAGRLVDGLTQAMEIFGVYLGVELGLYRALAALGAATEDELSGQTGVAARYAREWLEQQAVAGYLACDNPSDPAERRRFRLPAGHAEVLVDPDSPYHTAPLALALAGVAGVLPRLLAAYREGGGVAYAEYGRELRDGIAAANRPMFLHELASAWLPAVPDLHQRLRSAPPPRVLDLGCGLGASSVALAEAYPRATVLGVDLDEASVAAARAAAVEAGVADRVLFQVGDAAHLAQEAPFDLVTMFEALHDMGDPVGALRAARGTLADGGSVLVADERVADAFTAPGDTTERLMYGWSILHCLPATLAEDPVEATGTVLRAPTLARWAAAAGFAGADVVAIDNPFWRFYRLRVEGDGPRDRHGP
jgi:2-polyprenyl-3-methyl-5-hydroxy-6-metoxy-1,4-benzoquinol methylase